MSERILATDICFAFQIIIQSFTNYAHDKHNIGLGSMYFQNEPNN